MVPSEACIDRRQKKIDANQIILSCKKMNSPQVTAYLKTTCGWSKGVRAVLEKYDINFVEKDIILNPDFRLEMEQISGQPMSPCVIVNGVLLPDISGEELETYMLQNGLVGISDKTTDVPLNASCSH